MCFYYDETCEFGEDKAVKARKPHKCEACRETIQPGETYQRFSGSHDHRFFTENLCRRCCYDTFRIVEHELDEGCSWSEAWPIFSDIVPYLMDSELGQTKPEDVPLAFRVGDQPAWPRKESA